MLNILEIFTNDENLMDFGKFSLNLHLGETKRIPLAIGEFGS